MVEEHASPIEEGSTEEDPSKIRVDDRGSNPYARMGETLEDRIRHKEERRLGKAGKGITRRTGLSCRKGLNPVSKKQKKKLTEYKKARESHYSDEANQKCFLCGTTNNLSIHHSKGRGSNIAEEESFVTLCMLGRSMDASWPDSNHVHSGGCHGWVHANSTLAKQLGVTL